MGHRPSSILADRDRERSFRGVDPSRSNVNKGLSRLRGLMARGQNSLMRLRVWFVLLASLGLVGALSIFGCTTDYQKNLDDPSFGAPNALAGQKQPGSSTE